VFPQVRTGDTPLGAVITEIAAGVAKTKTFYTHTPEVDTTSLTGTTFFSNSNCFADTDTTININPYTQVPGLIASNKGKNLGVTPGNHDGVSDSIHPDFVLISTW
jgi:predicted anti-sigma-YlaC factor YlaD